MSQNSSWTALAYRGVIMIGCTIAFFGLMVLTMRSVSTEGVIRDIVAREESDEVSDVVPPRVNLVPLMPGRPELMSEYVTRLKGEIPIVRSEFKRKGYTMTECVIHERDDRFFAYVIIPVGHICLLDDETQKSMRFTRAKLCSRLYEEPNGWYRVDMLP